MEKRNLKQISSRDFELGADSYMKIIKTWGVKVYSGNTSYPPLLQNSWNFATVTPFCLLFICVSSAFHPHTLCGMNIVNKDFQKDEYGLNFPRRLKQ